MGGPEDKIMTICQITICDVNLDITCIYQRFPRTALSKYIVIISCCGDFFQTANEYKHIKVGTIKRCERNISYFKNHSFHIHISGKLTPAELFNPMEYKLYTRKPLHKYTMEIEFLQPFNCNMSRELSAASFASVNVKRKNTGGKIDI